MSMSCSNLEPPSDGLVRVAEGAASLAVGQKQQIAIGQDQHEASNTPAASSASYATTTATTNTAANAITGGNASLAIPDTLSNQATANPASASIESTSKQDLPSSPALDAIASVIVSPPTPQNLRFLAQDADLARQERVSGQSEGDKDYDAKLFELTSQLRSQLDLLGQSRISTLEHPISSRAVAATDDQLAASGSTTEQASEPSPITSSHSLGAKQSSASISDRRRVSAANRAGLDPDEVDAKGLTLELPVNIMSGSDVSGFGSTPPASSSKHSANAPPDLFPRGPVRQSSIESNSVNTKSPVLAHNLSVASRTVTERERGRSPRTTAPPALYAEGSSSSLLLSESSFNSSSSSVASPKLFSSLALPNPTSDLAHPIWSKPQEEQTVADSFGMRAGRGGAALHALLSHDVQSPNAALHLSNLEAGPSTRGGAISSRHRPQPHSDHHHYYHQHHHHQAHQEERGALGISSQRTSNSTSPSAIAALSRASTPGFTRDHHGLGGDGEGRAIDSGESGFNSHMHSPPDSGRSTPSIAHSSRSQRPQVLETRHLEVQTHAPSGKRMINQYIIEEELGRGVHGTVRLARDTETGERVAVKIVWRESRKRLGAGTNILAKARSRAREGKERQRDSSHQLQLGPAAEISQKGKSREAEPGDEGGPSDGSRASSPQARFMASPPRSPGAVAPRYGRWGDSGLSKPTFADKESERQKDKEREKERRALLMTTDQKVRREIAIMKKCSHENVVRLKEVIDDPHSKKIFMVLEFMAGGEVQWKTENGEPVMTVDEARSTIRDVVCGLEYLHYQGIIHRDIKPANLLWDENRRVKISDFGVSHFSYALLVSEKMNRDEGGALDSQDALLMDDHELAKTAGSPAFFAPELCLSGCESGPNTSNSSFTPIGGPGTATPSTGAGRGSLNAAEFPFSEAPSGNDGSRRPGSSSDKLAVVGAQPKPKRPRITKAIDVWALGVTLYCLLFGYPPFNADSEFILFSLIPTTDYVLPTFMGADRVKVGPRKPRWQSNTQWTDEEADAQPQDVKDLVPDARLEDLSEDARQVRDLLDRLLEKDPAKRIKLEDVKSHPWVVKGLQDAPTWLSETDPHQHPFVEITHEDVEGALTGFSKIKLRIKRLQTKFFDVIGHRKRSQSAAQSGLKTGGWVSSQSSATTPSGREGHSMFDTELENSQKSSGVSAPASSMVRTPKTPSHSSGSGSKPHSFFSRRQSAASIGKGSGQNAIRPLAPAAVEETSSKLAEYRVRDGCSSVPHSRPSSPLAHQYAHLEPQMGSAHDAKVGLSEAATLLRQIQAAPGNVSEPARRELMISRPPIIQRRSSSRSTTTAPIAARQVLDGRAPAFNRTSSDSQSRTALTEPKESTTGMKDVASDKAPRPGPGNVGRAGEAVITAPKAVTGSVRADHGSVHKGRTSIDSEGRLSYASGSQTPAFTSVPGHKKHNKLSDLFKSVWLAGDEARRGKAKSTVSKKAGTTGQISPAYSHRDSSSPFQSPASAGFSSPPRSQDTSLTVDTKGAVDQLGPRQAPHVPTSAPLPSLERLGAARCGGLTSDLPASAGMSSESLQYYRSTGGYSSPSPSASNGPSFSSIQQASHSYRSQRVELEHDDVDLDLELSDDDFDDDVRSNHQVGPILSNDGSGWVIRDNAIDDEDQFSASLSGRRGSMQGSAEDILTPSVEGGYNLFKPPYKHIISHPPSASSFGSRDAVAFATEGQDPALTATGSGGGVLHTMTTASQHQHGNLARTSGKEIINDGAGFELASGSRSGSGSNSNANSKSNSQSVSRSHSSSQPWSSRPSSQTGTHCDSHLETPSDDSSRNHVLHSGIDSGVAISPASGGVRGISGTGGIQGSAYALEEDSSQFADADEFDEFQPSSSSAAYHEDATSGFSHHRAPSSKSGKSSDLRHETGSAIDEDYDSDELCVSFEAKRSNRPHTTVTSGVRH
ncbi:Pkinase-domain-containing protein [Violaceomyces palustris]|uniref:Pkinase-domain-containing protein n=1 Tax=Violaceomyces palustris TaxID=1673888 RepID=A0ACD0NNP9_9BASI|nr:Pkinase-domain-containing protein [Violaceomyces palustris]